MAKSASGVAVMLRPFRGSALEGDEATPANLIQ